MSFWPHAPIHRLDQTGAYIVTAATYQKVHYFRSVALVDFLQENLVTLAKQYDWQLQAWAIFSNHYHFVALSPLNPSSLRGMISHLHSISAQEANQQDNAAGRKSLVPILGHTFDLRAFLLRPPELCPPESCAARSGAG